MIIHVPQPKKTASDATITVIDRIVNGTMEAAQVNGIIVRLAQGGSSLRLAQGDDAVYFPISQCEFAIRRMMLGHVSVS